MSTFSLQRIDERKLDEALVALKTAQARGEAEPLYPWLETWRAESCAQGNAGVDDFRVLIGAAFVGKPVDLLDRTPATLAGGQADRDLRSALLGLELGGGLEPWMREALDEAEGSDLTLRCDAVLGLLRAADVKRLCPRVQEIGPGAIDVAEDEAETYGAAWDRLRRTFAVAAERGEGLVFIQRV